MLALDYYFTGDFLKGEKQSIYDSWWDHYGDYVLFGIIVVVIALAIFLWYKIDMRKADRARPRIVTFYGYGEKECQYDSYLVADIPEKEGYIFCGWYKDTAFREPWKSKDKVTRDITLYPKWEKER